MTAKRSALIVATSDYKDSRLAPLEGPGRDADALRAVLANKDIGGFEVKLALNARVDTLRRTLESFFADRGRDDLLLLHFSGHGLKDDDGQLYLAAADTQIDRLLSTGVDAGWVNRLITRCRSERIALFLDCCFAGAFTSGLVRRAGVDTAGVNEHFTGTGRFVITASDAMQYAFEGGRQVGEVPEPSPFTQALVDGLHSGEADRNEDGNVSMDELFDFLEDRIRQTSPSQTPTKSTFNQVGDWVIARSTRAPSVRLLPEGLQVLLKSEEPLERFGALMELRDLLEGSDRRVAQAATQAVERLANDDSKRVAAAAQRMLDDETARPRSDGRGSRRRPAGDPVGVSRAAPAVDQIAADEASPEVTPASVASAEPVERPMTMGVMAEVADMPERSFVAPPEPALVEALMPAPVALPEAVMQAAPAAPAPVVAPAPEPAPVVAPPSAAPVVPPGPAFVAPPPVAPVVPPPARVSHWVEPTVHDRAGPPPQLATGGTVSVMAPLVGPMDAVSPRDATVGPPAVHWSLGRAAGRAAVGAFLWVLFQYVWFLVANQWLFENQNALDEATTAFGEMAGLVAVATGAIVATIEYAVPALRLPTGSAWRPVGGNRWVVAVMMGLATSLTIGLLIEFTYLTGKFDSMLGLGWEIPVCAIVGFLVAEGVFGRAGQTEG